MQVVSSFIIYSFSELMEISAPQCKFIEVQCAGNQIIVPVAGDVVTARVLQVNQRSAKCSILCIGEHILEQNYRAMLRKEDVRATEKDRVEMYKSFRPGDIILARVVGFYLIR